MAEDPTITLIRLGYALMAGALIGIERTNHGRAAGFRTHMLVCAASALLMLLSVFQWNVLLIDVPMRDTVRVDPTRMAQGIMTGIGFLGAGVIMKDRLSVRGLTTAASIWMTASVGIMIGMGLYLAAGVATGLTLFVLVVMRWVEDRLPAFRYARLTARFQRDEALSEETMHEIVERHALHGTQVSYHLVNEGRYIEYGMTLRSRSAESLRDLSRTLTQTPAVHEFSIVPSGA